MVQSSNPYDQFDTPGGLPAGAIQIAPPAPDYQYKGPAAAADLARARAAAAKATAETPYAARNAAAATTTAEAIATIDQAKADNVKALNALASMAPNSKLHGEAYFDAIHLPESQRVLARAYARGDLGGRSGGITTSMLPIIQNAMNYDPTTSATNFPARVAMQRDLAGNTPGTAGGSLRSMEQMLLHGANVLSTGQALDNFGPGILGTIGNEVRTGYLSATGDPELNSYNQEVKNYAPESQKGVAGSAGIGDERKERAEGYAASMPQAARAAALQADARMALERMGAVNDQYRRLMGKDITDQLSPAAKKAYDQIMAGGYDAKGNALYPAPGYIPGSIFGNGGNGGLPPGATPSPPPPPSGVASGATKDVYSPQASALIDQGIRHNWSDDQINRAIAPYHFGPVDPKQTAAARSYFAGHPDYKGSFGNAVQRQPTTLLNRASASAPAAIVTGVANGLTGGLLDEGSGVINAVTQGQPLSQAIDQANFAKYMMSRTHPDLYGAGNMAGMAGSFALGGLGAAKLGVTAALGKYAPLAGDLAYGALSGAGEDNNNRLGGAVIGGLGSTAGGMFGRKVVSPALSAVARTGPATGIANGVRGILGRPEVIPPSPLTAGQAMIAKAANKAGIPNITSQLDEATGLNVPMSLADTDPQLRELAGAAVRRSPTAAKVAEDALIPRNRGQIERFTNSVEQNLGPIGNIPQISDDLTAQARAAAAPLYVQAYAAPGASSAKIDELLQTPFGRQALGRARTIAANERRDPTSLGFDLDPQGNVTLNRVPSMQTLDYVKRGMDDVLEQYRNPITGRLQLDEAGRAQNGVKNDLLSEMDKINPAYAQARAAYAGPVQARDALAAGQSAYSLPPNTVGQMVASQSPENLAQMQLGYRDSLMNQANRVRYNANPFDATLGNPMAQQRARILHPDNPNLDTMFRQQALEGQLARNTNDILGNSKTAQRSIADDQFGGSDWPSQALDVGINLATGQVPTGVLFKAGTSRAIKDAFKMGIGKRAVQKAEEMAPILLNADPSASGSSLNSLLDQDQIYRDYVNSQKAAIARPLGMFGRALGTTGTGYYLN